MSAPKWYGHTSQWFFFKTTLNCLFDCSYCYLKGAFKNDIPVHFVNYDDIQSQIDSAITTFRQKNPSDTMRRYASDWSDTQWFDRFLDWNSEFFPFFGQYQNVMVETRTKSADISSLLAGQDVPSHVEVAVSLNPQTLIANYEKWTATLDQRIANINALLDRGWKVGLRFMPLLPVDNFLSIYEQFLQDLSKKIDLSKIYSHFAWGLLFTKDDYKRMLIKEPKLDVLYRLHDAWDGFVREKDAIRQQFYDLFEKYIPSCSVCMDG